MSEIRNRNVLVTGGASGIGRLVAFEMARRGGNVVLWDIDEENLIRVLNEIEAATGKKGVGHVCDVSDRRQVYRTAAEVRKTLGPLDILVNNAGVVSGKLLLDIPDEKIEATFAVNTLALFWTAKAFLPEMIARNRGHIVTVASAAGIIGVARLSDYSASKWAAVGFDESLRVELRRIAPGVRTTIVCPYYIDTGMFEGVRSRFRFLLPILRGHDVARRIVRAVERNRRRVLMLPLVYMVPGLRLLPVGILDAAADFFGINVSMDRFVGRESKGGTDAAR